MDPQRLHCSLSPLHDDYIWSYTAQRELIGALPTGALSVEAAAQADGIPQYLISYHSLISILALIGDLDLEKKQFTSMAGTTSVLRVEASTLRMSSTPLRIEQVLSLSQTCRQTRSKPTNAPSCCRHMSPMIGA